MKSKYGQIHFKSLAANVARFLTGLTISERYVLKV